MEAGHAHSVVAVAHEVSPTELQQAHRRQLLAEAKSSVDPLPPLRRGFGQGHKIRVEVLVLAYATYYPRHLDGSLTPIHSSTGRDTPSELRRGEEGAYSSLPKQACLQ